MRVVLDTNVLVAAVRSRRGASNAILTKAFEKRFDWVVSIPLFLEYEAVLTRAELLMAIEVTRASMSDFLTDIAAVITPVELHFLWRPQLRDPKDEIVLETAVNGQAELLITHNERDFVGAEAFSVTVLSPARFLERMLRMNKARVSLNLPASLKAAAERYAQRDGVSLNQFISMAVAEKVGAAGAVEFFEKRSAGGKPERALAFLEVAPDRPPLAGDESPN